MHKILIKILYVMLVFPQVGKSQTISETFGTGSNQFDIEFVQIGNPGNNADSNGRGAVNYTYNIGKYEVSRDLIIKANNSAGLNIDMYGFFTSSLKNPAPHVSWYEYAKFVNYLNTSKGYQPAYNFDSQGNFQAWSSGQYIGSNQFRHKDTKFFLPTLNEWYKAGYYDPQKNGGNGGYWKYATGSDSLPDQNLDGDNNWSPNEVVWGRETFPGPSEVDNAGTLSPYGTMAQNGNTSEWTEDVLDIAGEVRYKIGGHYAWKHDGFNESTIELDKAWAKSRYIGTRIAMVPEPSALPLVAIGLGGLAMLRRRRKILRRGALSIVSLSFVFSTNYLQAQLGFDNGTTWMDVGDPGQGSVSYSFKISKYETTVTQYASFLNSVAQVSDPYGLFHGFTWRYAEPINRSGAAGNYSYSVADGFQNRAITAMNWLDAARYVNWLHNGGTSSSDTETGVYTLNGITSLTIGTTISRGISAKFFIPTIEEWQKAGFYDPTKNGGSGGWWASANQSSTTPGDPAVMNINQAYFDPVRGYVTDVGYFTEQDSYYGTYDQSGNVWEWTEGATFSGTIGGLNGGGWDYFDGTYGSVMVGGNKAADFRKDSTGFRIGAIPEPSSLSLLLAGGAVLIAGRRRRD